MRRKIDDEGELFKVIYNGGLLSHSFEDAAYMPIKKFLPSNVQLTLYLNQVKGDMLEMFIQLISIK